MVTKLHIGGKCAHVRARDYSIKYKKVMKVLDRDETDRHGTCFIRALLCSYFEKSLHTFARTQPCVSGSAATTGDQNFIKTDRAILEFRPQCDFRL